MKQVLELLSQRRVWAGIVGVIAFTVTLLGSTFQIDVPVLTNLLTDFGIAVAGLASAGLALWSYFKPKK